MGIRPLRLSPIMLVGIFPNRSVLVLRQKFFVAFEKRHEQTTLQVQDQGNQAVFLHGSDTPQILLIRQRISDLYGADLQQEGNDCQGGFCCSRKNGIACKGESESFTDPRPGHSQIQIALKGALRAGEALHYSHMTTVAQHGSPECGYCLQAASRSSRSST